MARMEESGSLSLLLVLGFMALFHHVVLASDPDLTTDFGINTTSATDFAFTGFRNVAKDVKGKSTVVPAIIPGLKGLGLTAVRIEFGPQSQVNPHHHPRATEIFYLLSGQVDVGFVDTNNTLFQTIPLNDTSACEPDQPWMHAGQVDVGFVDTNNTLFQTTLQAGDLFVFPKGLVHFLRNNEWDTASGYSTLSSENPGTLAEVPALFTASQTGLPDIVLSTAFGTDIQTVQTVKKALATANA